MASEITIPVPGGGRLCGLVNLTGSPGCVLYVHGFGSHHKGEKPTAVQDACLRRAWSYAAFDFRGHGGSSGTMRDLRASGLQTDLLAIRDYLAGEGVKRLFLVGSSMGGFASAWFALDNPDLVTAMALLSPAFRFLQRRWDALTQQDQQAWRESGTIRYRNQWLDVELDVALIDERASYDADDLADRWQTPALIFHGLRDETVPWQDTIALAERTRYPGLQLRLFGDGDHRLLDYRHEMAEEACRFFARWA